MHHLSCGVDAVIKVVSSLKRPHKPTRSSREGEDYTALLAEARVSQGIVLTGTETPCTTIKLPPGPALIVRPSKVSIVPALSIV